MKSQGDKVVSLHSYGPFGMLRDYTLRRRAKPLFKRHFPGERFPPPITAIDIRKGVVVAYKDGLGRWWDVSE